jgi:trehalose 6-phosphate phosphatase
MTNQFSAILSASSGPVALFADFDGTLVEIAPRPDAIEVPEVLVERLRAVEKRLDGALAIISGRTIADIDSYLAAPNFTISGSHGAEQRHAGKLKPSPPEFSHAAAIIDKALRASFRDDHRILVERKPSGVAVHYRAAPERGGDVRVAMQHALAGAEGFHAIEGKKVIEARPEGADKGAAIAKLMQQSPFKDRTPMFIGDDITDEDGFRTVNAMGGITIKIGVGETDARFRLPDVSSVLEFLEMLAEGTPKIAGKTHLREAMQ